MTYEEYIIIATSAAEMAASCRTALGPLVKIRGPNRTTMIVNQITYWKNCISAFRWQAGKAWQRVKDKDGRQPVAI